MLPIDDILKIAFEGSVSDVILKVGSVPKFRFQGRLMDLQGAPKLTIELLEHWMTVLLSSTQKATFQNKGDVDFAFQSKHGYRFRGNLFRQSGLPALVMRVLAPRPKSLDELLLPDSLRGAADLKRGLVLVTGATGSGKSSTLAALVEEINKTRQAHIITIEDPIEIYSQEKKSVVNQRELGVDTTDYTQALKAALRQNPDVIMVGELRDAASMEIALMAAETGHLVLSTLHTQDCVESLTRILSFFSPHQHSNIRLQLAHSLKMIVSQRLVSKVQGRGMIAACEILMVNSLVQDLIVDGESFGAIQELIRKGHHSYGMQTFDQALYELYQKGHITQEMAIQEASSREAMKLMLSGIS